ncbi:hypothetical protein D8S78_23070 [Natrialba swarupiae]|nr:hypothetical protein [Natrialba swarupiae]
MLLSILNALDSNGQVTNGVIRYKGKKSRICLNRN